MEKIEYEEWWERFKDLPQSEKDRLLYELLGWQHQMVNWVIMRMDDRDYITGRFQKLEARITELEKQLVCEVCGEPAKYFVSGKRHLCQNHWEEPFKPNQEPPVPWEEVEEAIKYLVETSKPSQENCSYCGSAGWKGNGNSRRCVICQRLWKPATPPQNDTSQVGTDSNNVAQTKNSDTEPWQPKIDFFLSPDNGWTIRIHADWTQEQAEQIRDQIAKLLKGEG